MGRSCQNLVARRRAEGSVPRCKGKRKEKAARCFYVFHTRSQGACAGCCHGVDRTIGQMRVLCSFPRKRESKAINLGPALPRGRTDNGTCACGWMIEMKIKMTTKTREAKT